MVVEILDVDSGDPSTAVPAFARLLARLRKAAGLTQEGLADRSGISARAISDMERGRVRRPQYRTRLALATAFATVGQSSHDLLLSAGERSGPGGEPLARADRAEPEPRFERLLRELPPEVADITGRERELTRLLRLIKDRAADDHPTATVITLFGLPGVGKTTFAVHIGHRLIEHYPDGCFFLDLHGMDAGRLTPEQALGHLLLALGVAEGRLPQGVEERAGLYRSLLRNRKIVLVFDNVADEAQIRPLLPGSPHCLVLLTSRRALPGLESVHRVLLDVLSPEASVSLLGSIIDPARAAADPEAAARVAELCGHLPLALRIAGNRLASRPRWPLGTLVRQLDDQQRRLTALTAGDLEIRSAFEVSYRLCEEPTRSLFRRLSLARGDEITVDMAAQLAAVEPDVAEHTLEALVDASLLDTSVVEGQYVLHDLLRLFARERLIAEDPADEVRRIAAHMTDWLSRTGARAVRLLSTTRGSAEKPLLLPSALGTDPMAAALGLDA
ncbi:helix-turn-helix domain-containing protein [Amycolatopsis pigmentata]|uniref:Helix-turn-helix domain-containing protein n=1 Tax=Amycolatopsis pigmentata TaxID=450801 RepID=A0ABW5FRD2_9PSEU